MTASPATLGGGDDCTAPVQRPETDQASVAVDITALAVSRDPGAVLVAHSLGSSIGVSVWDPAARVAGLLRFMLPDSSVAPEAAEKHPEMFCDTGVPRLFKAACELGAASRRLVVRIAGGSQLLNNTSEFNVGKRNYLALRRLFWKNRFAIAAENVGGAVSRTMTIRTSDGVVRIKAREAEASL